MCTLPLILVIFLQTYIAATLARSGTASSDDAIFESFHIPERMANFKIPGVSIALIRNSTIQWTKGYGFADREANRTVDPSTLFQAASISKPVAALASLNLVEAGHLSLDGNINQYLKFWQVPENQYTTHEKVTLRRLVTHTAGLTVHGFRGYAKGEPIPSLIQILDGVRPPANSDAVFVNATPGTESKYSGGGYTVMQKAMVDQMGKRFPQLMSDIVLSKIGMTRSTYEQPLPAQLHSEAATGYDVDGTPIPGTNLIPFVQLLDLITN